MKKYYSMTFLLLVIAPFVMAAPEGKDTTEETEIKLIKDTITDICDKPGNAGSYWTANVKGDAATIKFLKLAEIGITGEADFSKGEWDGIRKTIEDTKDYRACVKELTPLFIERFRPVIKRQREEKEKKASGRILGGIKYQLSQGGVTMTVDSCKRKAGSVVCDLTARAEHSDVGFTIYESSYLYDQSGYQFGPHYASVANFVQEWLENGHIGELESKLIKGVDTPISMRFDNVRPEAVTISKVMVMAYIADKGKHTFNFRDVKIGL